MLMSYQQLSVIYCWGGGGGVILVSFYGYAIELADKERH